MGEQPSVCESVFSLSLCQRNDGKQQGIEIPMTSAAFLALSASVEVKTTVSGLESCRRRQLLEDCQLGGGLGGLRSDLLE
jgi:hypothetical protein